MEIIFLNKRIKCSKFVASFLSPKISRCIRHDPTITKYYIKFPERTEYYSNEEELNNLLERTNFYSQIESILNGGSFHFKPSSEERGKKIYETYIYRILSDFCESIGNSELIEQIIEYGEDIEINYTNLNEIIKINRRNFDSKIYQRYIEFFAKKFYLFISSKSEDKSKDKEEDSELLKYITLTYEELVDIISSKQLQIKNEDSLFEYIIKLGPEFYSLLDFIEVQYLSCQSIKEMIDITRDPEFNIHEQLWSSIYRRLILEPNEKHELHNPREIPPPKPKAIDSSEGIIKHLPTNINRIHMYAAPLRLKLQEFNMAKLSIYLTGQKKLFSVFTITINQTASLLLISKT